MCHYLKKCYIFTHMKAYFNFNNIMIIHMYVRMYTTTNVYIYIQINEGSKDVRISYRFEK